MCVQRDVVRFLSENTALPKIKGFKHTLKLFRVRSSASAHLVCHLHAVMGLPVPTYRVVSPIRLGKCDSWAPLKAQNN